MLVEANVTIAGRAESILQCSHVTQTRYAHEVSFVTLTILRQEAFIESGSRDFNEWHKTQCEDSIMYRYWSTVIDLELMLLMFVWSLRESNCVLNIDCLVKIAPCFFAFDKHNYARWVSVHIRDLQVLSRKLPAVLDAFKQGKFTVNKSY